MSFFKRFREITSGDFFLNQRLKRRFPIFLVFFVLLVAYIGDGVYIQTLHKQEDQLNAKYTELQSVAIDYQNERVRVTRKEHIQKLIQEYHLNIITTPTVPIIIQAQ